MNKPIMAHYFFAFILGLLLPLAFAPYKLFPLAIIAPAGLLILLHKQSKKNAAWLGFIFGLGFFGLGVYWIYISIHFFGEVPYSLTILITAGLIAILALFPALTCYLTNRFFATAPPAKNFLAFSAIWVLSEWVRSWLFTGFPWLFLGYSQTNSPLKGFAPLLSVYGVSLAVLVSSALLSHFLLDFRNRKNLLWLAIIWLSGGALSFIPWTTPYGDPVAVSLIQGDIPQTIKWSPEHLNLSLNRYAALTDTAWGKNKLIIWPESAIPMSINDASAYIDAMDKKAQETQSHLILGIPIETANRDGYYNALVSLGKDQQVYLKRRLVPFGEYTPMQALLTPLFNVLNIPMSNLVPGQYQQPFLLVNHLKILASICYEVAFPEMNLTNDKTLDLLLTVTNDAWFGESSAQAQHLQMAAMRAIELARPLLFASNNGITAFIAPNGKITLAAPTHQAYVLTGQVQAMHGLTPWMRNGTDPILFILICILVVAVKARHPQPQETPDERTI